MIRKSEEIVGDFVKNHFWFSDILIFQFSGKNMIRLAGRIFQLIGLVAMPAAIFVAEVDHNEKGCIAIFTASIVVFILGYLLTRVSSKS